MEKAKKNSTTARPAKRNKSELLKLLLKGPTWTEKQYKDWLKGRKILFKWRVK